MHFCFKTMEFINLIESVSELLYKHNCVIIPGFGGFITNYKPSGFEESRNLISPSSKKVAFNQLLIENDGLLINSWSQKNEISYQEAEEDILAFSAYLKDKITINKSFDFENIGTFYSNAEGKIIFVPYQGFNFLESSYGLFPIKIKPLAAQVVVSNLKVVEEIQEPITAFNKEVIGNKKATKQFHFSNMFLLKAASLVLMAAVAVFVLYYLGNNNKNKGTAYQPKSEQNASFIYIDTNHKKASKAKEVSIAGLEYKAERKKINELKTQLNSFSELNSPKQETYNVVVGYYKNETQANKILIKLQIDYSNAILAEPTNEGYAIVVESFFKHTTAEAFSVMLKQNGFKNISIEKHVVFGQ